MQLQTDKVQTNFLVSSLIESCIRFAADKIKEHIVTLRSSEFVHPSFVNQQHFERVPHDRSLRQPNYDSVQGT